MLDPPIDTDGDGRPNYRDPDSDNDLIMDGDEFGLDTDRDGLFDQEDLDSDADGWTDEQEAGDADVFSPPIDSDGDTIPDFRDPDSDDNDGLSDARTSSSWAATRAWPTRTVDGVTDLIELAAGTDPNDPTVSPRGPAATSSSWCPSRSRRRRTATRSSSARASSSPTSTSCSTPRAR
ncbi:MAG: hypothetical protein SangKO_009780 [Sandaracinaceae bacterium]